jgi:hypothetical protein
MNALWRCSVCEAVNQGGHECSACGAAMTRRSAAATSVRGRVAPVPMLSVPPEPLPPPVRRAVNREPVVEEEWPYDDELSFKMIPGPGCCIVVGTPRGWR